MTHKRQASVPGDRAMPAPYNFVPLPEDVFRPAEPVPAALEPWRDDLKTGTIEYEVTTLTPTYTRGPSVKTERDARPQPEFYHHGDPARPVLPGSSIRGLMRAMVGLISDAHLPRTKRDRRLFYRTFGSDALSRVYGEKFIERVQGARGAAGPLLGFRGRSKPGFLVRRDGRWYIQPTFALRVGHTELGGPPYVAPNQHRDGGGERPIGLPDPAKQHQPVWFRTQSIEPTWLHHKAAQGPGGMYTWGRYVDTFSFRAPPAPSDWRQGWLVITGPMAKKRSEYVFSTPEANASALWPVDDVLIRELEDEQDQLTAWQEGAFPKDGRFQDADGQPKALVRPERGGPPGLPVWCLLTDSGKVTALGRAANFRLRYIRKVDDNVPAAIQYPESLPKDGPLDLVDRLFGYVRQPGEDDAEQRRGRLRFSDAVCGDANPFLTPLANSKTPDRIPLILSSPKPTAYQMYLVQNRVDKLSLDHFDSAGGLIRGTKLYWHKNRPGPNGEPLPPDEKEMFRTDRADRPTGQETVIRPVRAGVRFRGQLTFENLTDVELGALLSALDLPPGLAHKVGMGKPRGMGSVRLGNVRVLLESRRARYSSWDPPAPAQVVETAEALKELKRPFQAALVPYAERAYGRAMPEGTGVWQLPRQATLGLMLGWNAAPPSHRIQYLTVQGEEGQNWKERKVLPAPHTVADQADPYAGIAAPAVPLPVAPANVPLRAPGQRPFNPRQAEAARPSNPDDVPRGTRAEAKITSGAPGAFKVQLVGGVRTWDLRGSPPPGLRPKLQDMVNVRIHERGGPWVVVFDQASR